MAKKLLVDVIIPVLNEEDYIYDCISSLQSQTYGPENFGIIVVDGGSDDETVKIVMELKEKYPNITLLQHNGKYASISLNMAVKKSDAIYIIRMDVHADYSYDYVEKCVEYIESTGADNVGGPMIPVGKSSFQKVVAASYYSKFALGARKLHDPQYEGDVDTVYLGSFKRETLLNMGMYDENLHRNEGRDLDFRIVKNGGRVFLTPKIRTYYYPRDSIEGVFRQYFEYGYGKIALIKKHKRPLNLLQLVPFAFLLFLIVGAVISSVNMYFRYFYIAMLILYLCFDAVFSISNRHIKGAGQKLLLMAVHFIIHMAYGLGFSRGIVDLLIFRRESRIGLSK